jgi:hypothetical protein
MPEMSEIGHASAATADVGVLFVNLHVTDLLDPVLMAPGTPLSIVSILRALPNARPGCLRRRAANRAPQRRPRWRPSKRLPSRCPLCAAGPHHGAPCEHPQIADVAFDEITEIVPSRATDFGEPPPVPVARDCALLLRMDGVEAGRSHRLTEEPCRIGRHASSELRIDDTRISAVTRASFTTARATYRRSRLAQRNPRARPVFARIGGEEFAVVLRGIDTAGAGRVGERLRATIAAVPVVAAAHPVPVTISVGCTALSCCREASAAALFAGADARL